MTFYNTLRGAGDMKMKAEIGVMWLKPRNASSYQKLKVERNGFFSRGTDFFLESYRACGPADTLILA